MGYEASIQNTTDSWGQEHSIITKIELHSSPDGGGKVDVDRDLAIGAHSGDHSIIANFPGLKMEVFSRPFQPAS